MHARNGVLFRRLIKLMREHGWEPIRIKLNGVDGGDVTERVRGYQRKTNRLPYGHISKEFPGKIDTSTPYVIGKVVSRLEMDSRWALARAVRALVAERDALKETHETRQCATEQTSTRWAKTGAHNPFENITPPATSGLITHRGRVPADDSASDRDD
jgi:hypothetical protein